MASSRGRERLREREQRNFAFGSSTPRDLSHMNKIPPQLRKYDAKPVVDRTETPDLRVYIQKARSLTRERDSNERTSADTPRHWAFGSSTPRALSHIDKIPVSQRVYDAKIPKKSTTSPEFKTINKKSRSHTTPPITRQPLISPKKLKKRMEKDDEVASEPDFIQDREEFLAEIRKRQAEAQELKKAHEIKPIRTDDNKNGEKKNVAMLEIEMNSKHAVEVTAPISHERVATSTHKEEQEIASENLKQEGNQQVISELNESHEADDGEEGKTPPQRKETLINNLLRKVEGAVEESLAETTEIAEDLQETARSTEIGAKKGLSELLDGVSKASTNESDHDN